MNTEYCNTCRKATPYTIDWFTRGFRVCGNVGKFKQRVATCDVCGQVMYVPWVVLANADDREAAYRKAGRYAGAPFGGKPRRDDAGPDGEEQDAADGPDEEQMPEDPDSTEEPADENGDEA